MPFKQLNLKPSGAIKLAEYDQKENTLRITFDKGGVYHYSNVSPQDVRELENASSPGSHFRKYIQDSFPCKRC